MTRHIKFLLSFALLFLATVVAQVLSNVISEYLRGFYQSLQTPLIWGAFLIASAVLVWFQLRGQAPQPSPGGGIVPKNGCAIWGLLRTVLLIIVALSILMIPCVGLFYSVTDYHSSDVRIEAFASDTVRSGEPFTMLVTMTNNTGDDGTFTLSVVPSNGTLELLSAEPAPDSISNMFQTDVMSYGRIRAGESRTIALGLRATGQGRMIVTVRGNVGIFKGRSTTTTITILP